MKRWTIGVDPGLTGGITFLNSDGECYAYPMPLVGKEVDLGWIVDKCSRFRQLVGWSGWHAWIEKAQAFPGVTKRELCPQCGFATERRQSQGVVSTGTSMRGAGLLEGCFSGMGIKCTRVAAKDWQRFMLGPVPRGRKAIKAASIVEAQKLFRSVTFKRTPRCTTCSDGMTDSALIAAYGSRSTVV